MQEELHTEVDIDAPLSQELMRIMNSRRKKRNIRARAKKPQEPAQEFLTIECPRKVLISEFDYSVKNHFEAIDIIAKLCGHTEILDANQADILQFSKSIIFLREWRDFNYAPRVVTFACQHNSEEKDITSEVTLPQFSSAYVPKQKLPQNGSEVTGTKSCKDFLMNVGGAVWALDWCPRDDHNLENSIKSEFVAVAAHPPDSSYHKIGAPLTGRGVIQIWCILNSRDQENVPSQGNKKRRNDTPTTLIKKPKGRPRKKPIIDTPTTLIKKPKGRPKKNPLIDTESIPSFQPLAIEYPEGTSVNTSEHRDFSLKPHEEINGESSCDVNTSRDSIPESVALPRMMLCLAHNGKVAWDAKWRPLIGGDPQSTNRMGYLAVLLGSGAIEVWDVPLPHTVKNLYPADEERADPRFIKLRPVFRCSIMKCGDRQSIPLTVEWSVSSPHDMILAGCHDGVVALWKFSISDSAIETRPLLSFSADTGPIRTLAWAPMQSDLESANLILTAGHKGFKFWDIRDPFRPLWDHAIPGAVYSLDWLPNPKCVFGSIDDGTLWLLNLMKATSDIPVSGKPLPSTKTGIHNFDCASFSIWSVQASKLTGMVAYCGEDGTTFCFQPTARSVNDPSRNRVPHYLCGSLLEEELGFTVISPSTITPFIKRSPSMKRGVINIKDQEKKNKEQLPVDQTRDKKILAICRGSEKVDQISKESSKSNSRNDQNKIEGDGISKEEIKEEIEVLPSKIVAIHRVRWNVNKGSERWLCYGGAAGLVRCQEIDLPDVR